MNLLSRRSVLAIAAVVDIALHSRSVARCRQGARGSAQVAAAPSRDPASGPRPCKNPQRRSRTPRRLRTGA